MFAIQRKSDNMVFIIVLYHTVCVANQSKVLNIYLKAYCYPIVASNQERVVFLCHFHMSFLCQTIGLLLWELENVSIVKEKKYMQILPSDVRVC